MVRDPQNSSEKAAAALRRDAALNRIGHARRWLIAGPAALTAALAALASALLPGKSLGAKSHPASPAPKASTQASSPSAAPALPPRAGAAALGLGGGDES